MSSAMLVGVIAGPPIAAGFVYVIRWWTTRNYHPVYHPYTEHHSVLSVLVVGAVVGLFLGIVGGYLYKHFARKT